METQVHQDTTPPSAETPATRPAPPERTRVATPRVDIYENEQEILLFLDVPGVAAPDVHLELDRSELTLSAVTSTGNPFGPIRWTRTFLVPRGLAADGVKAELRDGVLRVSLPKGESAKRRTVEVISA